MSSLKNSKSSENLKGNFSFDISKGNTPNSRYYQDPNKGIIRKSLK